MTRVCWSFHYFEEVDLASACDMLGGPDVLADSGAFSAFTQGKTIDVGAYVAWVNRWASRFSIASAPDVIGDVEKTTRATEHMLDEVADVPVMPVFHVGDPWQHLERWCADTRIEYLAFGGMVPYVLGKRALLRAWLDKAFAMVPARLKVHGFGLTTMALLQDFPWFSVDSSNWTAFARYAELRLFDSRRGRFVHTNMRSRVEVLRNADLLKSYGLAASSTFVDNGGAANRDVIARASWEAWSRAESWLRARKAARGVGVERIYLSSVPSSGVPNNPQTIARFLGGS